MAIKIVPYFPKHKPGNLLKKPASINSRQGGGRFLNLSKLILLIFAAGALLYFFFFLQEFSMEMQQMRSIKIDQRRQFKIAFKNVQMAYSMDLPGRESPACPEGTKLLILMMTRRGAFQNRIGIRRTWLKGAVNGTVARFLVADSPAAVVANPKDLSSALLQRILLQDEQRQYRDLIFLHGIEDSYANLHLKWLAGLHWQQAFCADAKWIMKTDDDTVVHLPRLDHWIERKFRAELRKNAATYFGWIISGVGPIRQKGHKWYVSRKSYPGSKYPAYMQGATYIASRAAISAVLKWTPQVGGFNMDDVLFTGILADLANVTKSDHKEMFRVGKSLAQNEHCEGGVPFVTALYDANTLQEFEQIYDMLNAVRCPMGK